jgi:hypothetical protein
MPARAKRAIPLLLGCATLAATAATALAAGPPPLKVVNQGKTVTASQGSYCYEGACADFAYPLPVACGVRAKPGANLTIRTGEMVIGLTGRLIIDFRKGRPVYAKWKATYSGRPVDEVRLHLPGKKYRVKLNRVIALDLFVRYAVGGDSNGWTGLATPGCRQAGLPKP